MRRPLGEQIRATANSSNCGENPNIGTAPVANRQCGANSSSVLSRQRFRPAKPPPNGRTPGQNLWESRTRPRFVGISARFGASSCVMAIDAVIHDVDISDAVRCQTPILLQCHPALCLDGCVNRVKMKLTQ